MSWIKGLSDRLPEMSLPTLGREAEIAVYLIHNSGDAEDYFFLFDFEEFVDRSKGGIFVRPVLRVLAGRDDFNRVVFARQFREVFAREFDRMRAEQGAKSGKGWLSFGGNSIVDVLGGFVANLVLAVALSMGKQVLSMVGLKDLLQGKSAEAKLADEIDRTKDKVEAALAGLEVRLHPELLDHAERVGGPQKRADLDRDAWPLPDYVRAHLRDGESGSWW
ncbi:hypothetical protein V8J82_03385 [Gymnodinialimonas sp. 2305UL16-5]|uniref:hypothetical protein n=1 Tax=Gymnodinialimonas mytili TaxID=3126503 RepID=UPI0030A2684F